MVPYKKIGFDYPHRKHVTIWNKEGGNHRQVRQSPIHILHDINKRPLYMVDTFAGLRRMRIIDENPRINIVVMKPMPNKRAFT